MACRWDNKDLEKAKEISIVKANHKDLKAVLETASLTRRAFFQWLSSLSLMATVESLNLSLSNEANASGLNPFGIASLINVSCVFCTITGLCFKITSKGIKIGPKIHYRIPVGFSETGKAFEFGASAPVLGSLASIFSSFARALMPFVPTGSMSITNGHGEQYMELYPHYYGFPPVVSTAIKTIIMKANMLDPACVCNILDDIIDYIVPVADIENAVNKELGGVLSKISSISNKIGSFSFSGSSAPGGSSSSSIPNLKPIKSIMSKLGKIFHDFQTAFKIIPIVPSELFFFMWNIEEFSPDNYTVAPLFDSILTTIPATRLVCPWAFVEISKHFPKLPLGIDPSFICVGYWGFGYPRIGIVRNDDPIEAGLLSIARWHHLMSRTIPLIQTPFDGNIYYQLYNPPSTPMGNQCFRPGYATSDRLSYLMNEVQHISLSSIENILSNPTSIFNEAKSMAESMLKQGVSGALPNYRNVGVVVWQERVKCCF